MIVEKMTMALYWQQSSKYHLMTIFWPDADAIDMTRYNQNDTQYCWYNQNIAIFWPETTWTITINIIDSDTKIIPILRFQTIIGRRLVRLAEFEDNCLKTNDGPSNHEGIIKWVLTGDRGNAKGSLYIAWFERSEQSMKWHSLCM